MRITFRLATEEDAAHVGTCLRKADRTELDRGSGHAPVYAAIQSVRASLIAWTMVSAEGEPLAVFGVAPHKKQPGVGVVWLLGTEHVRRAGKTLVQKGRHYVDLMSRLFPTLINAVDVDNRVSRAWLRRLGFTEDGPVQLREKFPFVIIRYERPANV